MSVRCYIFRCPRRPGGEHQATWSGTAAGHAVAARGGVRVAGPVNREPTARSQIAAGILVPRRGGGCQAGIKPHKAIPLYHLGLLWLLLQGDCKPPKPG